MRYGLGIPIHLRHYLCYSIDIVDIRVAFSSMGMQVAKDEEPQLIKQTMPI